MKLSHLQLRDLLFKEGLRIVDSKHHAPGGQDATLKLHRILSGVERGGN